MHCHQVFETMRLGTYVILCLLWMTALKRLRNVWRRTKLTMATVKIIKPLWDHNFHKSWLGQSRMDVLQRNWILMKVFFVFTRSKMCTPWLKCAKLIWDYLWLNYRLLIRRHTSPFIRKSVVPVWKVSEGWQFRNVGHVYWCICIFGWVMF